MSANESPLHRFAYDAMATTFEVVIRGQEKDYARQAAMAALDEVGRIEKELSRFLPSSDISQINRLQPGESVRVGIAAFECLELAKRVFKEMGGTFDVSLGTGLEHVHLDEAKHAVRIERKNVKIDLGGIGKGYAVDQVASVLADWSIEEVLLHAGESTALAVGSWSVEIRDPENQAKAIERVNLRNRALSGSGIQLQGEHIIDPRSGQPVKGKLGAWAAAPTAALSDALSTAFMVMSPGQVEAYCARHADVSGLILPSGSAGRKLLRFGAPLS